MHRLAAGGSGLCREEWADLVKWVRGVGPPTLTVLKLWISGLFVRRNAVASAIFDFITMNISKVLEAIFDQIEYRLAKRALRHAS